MLLITSIPKLFLRPISRVAQQVRDIGTTRCLFGSGADEQPQFPGSRSRWTEKLEFLKSETMAGIPVYRVMNRDGEVIDSSQDPNLGQEETTRIYKGVFRGEGCHMFAQFSTFCRQQECLCSTSWIEFFTSLKDRDAYPST